MINRRYAVFALSLSIMILTCLSVEAQNQQARLALVIGNAQYTRLPPADQLRNPINDARDMAAELRQLGFRVDLLTNAGLQPMEDAVARFGEQLSASKSSVGLFYYAGHGVQANGRNYLIPSDAYVAGPGFLATNTLQLQSVLDTLHQAGNELNIVVLDACRDNPFRWSRSLGANRGLAVVGTQPQGSIVAYAAAAGRTAEDGAGPNGVYTGELLKYLGRPGLDILDMFRDVGRAVSKVTNGYRQPAIYSQFNGDFYLAGHTSVPSTPVQTMPPPRTVGSDSLSILQQQRDKLMTQLGNLKETRASRGRTGGILGALGIAGGGVAVLCYFLASRALTSYLSATTGPDASTYHSKFETYGGLFLGSTVVGAGLLVGGLGFFASIPSTASVEAKIRNLDVQIRAVGAAQQIGP